MNLNGILLYSEIKTSYKIAALVLCWTGILWLFWPRNKYSCKDKLPHWYSPVRCLGAQRGIYNTWVWCLWSCPGSSSGGVICSVAVRFSSSPSLISFHSGINKTYRKKSSGKKCAVLSQYESLIANKKLFMEKKTL